MQAASAGWIVKTAGLATVRRRRAPFVMVDFATSGTAGQAKSPFPESIQWTAVIRMRWVAAVTAIVAASRMAIIATSDGPGYAPG